MKTTNQLKVFSKSLVILTLLLIPTSNSFQWENCKKEEVIHVDTDQNYEIIVDSTDKVYFYDVPPTPFSVSKRYFSCKKEGKCDFSSLPNAILLKNDTIVLEKNKFTEVTMYIVDELGNRLDLKVRRMLHSWDDNITLDSEIYHNLKPKIEKKNKETAINLEEKLKIREELTTSYFPSRICKEIFNLTQDIFDEEFISLIKNPPKTKSELLTRIKAETSTGIYSFQLFTKSFCEKLIKEIENIQKSGLNLKSPNSMNRFGVVLDDFGFHDFLDKLMKTYLSPLTTILYPDWGGNSLDSHHGFAIEYQLKKDEKLDYHMDSSDVTLNVCLGKQFKGGTLYFNGVRNDVSENKEYFMYDHNVGRAILHVGQHWHGAKKIYEGERYNLILWMMSSDFRKSRSEKFVEYCESFYPKMYCIDL